MRYKLRCPRNELFIVETVALSKMQKGKIGADCTCIYIKVQIYMYIYVYGRFYFNRLKDPSVYQKRNENASSNSTPEEPCATEM